MSEVLRRYKLFVLIVGLLFLIAVFLLWMIISKQHVSRIPSRGVFVISGLSSIGMVFFKA